jgi:hypothetical protein
MEIVMENRIKKLYLFMTELDSISFLDYMKENKSLCLDVKPSQIEGVEVIDKIPVSIRNNNIIYAILNTSIVSLNEYVSNFEQISGFYHYPQIGKGIIQFQPCYLSNYNKNCLMWGRLAASYNDENTDKWVKNSFNWIKKNGKKVYRTSITRNISADKSEKDVFSLSDASKVYDGSESRYLTIGKDIYCITR